MSLIQDQMKTRQSLKRAAIMMTLLTNWVAVQAQFSFTTNADNSLTITAYTGPGGTVVIPAVTNGLPVTVISGYPQSAFNNVSAPTTVAIPPTVTNIASLAFGYCTGLMAINVDESNSAFSSTDGILYDKNQSVLITYPRGRAGAYTIPNSVTTIGDYGFQWCYGLTAITIPEGVTSIGKQAFWNDNHLTSVAVPASVTNIEVSAFSECEAMTGINVDPANGFYRDVDGVLFDIKQTTLMQYPAGATNASYAISGSVTNIATDAFSGSQKLTSLTIPTSVTTIDESAFFSSGLSSLTLPDSITSIALFAFSTCFNLTNVIVGSGVTTVWDSAFWNCSSLKTVYFRGNAPMVIGAPFRQAYNVTVYYLPGTTGRGTTLGGRPTAQWWLPYPLILNKPYFGMGTNGFGFIVSWATNLSVAIDGCTNLAEPVWSSLSTNLLTNGWFFFSDFYSANYPARFYRARWLQ